MREPGVADGRIRVGVIGCGSIAQMVHLPFLVELDDQFVVTALCDVAEDTLDEVGERYSVPKHARYTDYRQMGESDLVDAVIICPMGTHVPHAVAALRNGKHVLVEKPLGYGLDEADHFAEEAEAARARSGAVTLMAYMKRFDPGYQYGQRLVRPLAEAGRIRYVDSRHLHAENDVWMAHYDIIRGTKVPHAAKDQAARESAAFADAAVGAEAPAAVRRVFFSMMGSAIHDVYCLNGLLGRPVDIIASETWDEGRCYNAMFLYPNGVRVNYAWIDVRMIREFTQDMMCFADDRRITISFPQPYLKSKPTVVRVQAMEDVPVSAPPGYDPDDTSWPPGGPAHWEKTVIASHDNAYKRELRHFHACITRGVAPLAGAEDARLDTRFVIDWARATTAR